MKKLIVALLVVAFAASTAFAGFDTISDAVHEAIRACEIFHR